MGELEGIALIAAEDILEFRLLQCFVLYSNVHAHININLSIMYKQTKKYAQKKKKKIKEKFYMMMVILQIYLPPGEVQRYILKKK